jgi:hypothetical protein
VTFGIPTAAVRFVLGLCEQPDPTVQRSEAPRSLLIAEADEHGLLDRLTNADQVTCRACYEDHDADVDFDEATQRYTHFCPEAGTVTVEAAQLHRFGVNFPRLIDFLREAFDLRNRPNARCLMEDVLWDLGDVMVADARHPLLFARRLSFSSNLIGVREMLARRPPRGTGLCIHASPHTLAVDTLPGGHRVFPILEFITDKNVFTIDEALLAGALAGRPTADSELVQCSDDGSWIRIGDREYAFSGVHQMAIVRAVFEAWRRRSPRIRTQPLLEEIGCRSKQVSQIFGNADPRWREVIGYGRGYVWLQVPEK